MKMQLLSPNKNDKAFWVEWRYGRIVFSISIEADGDAGWWYMDYTKPERIHQYGDIDMKTLRKLYDILKGIFDGK